MNAKDAWKFLVEKGYLIQGNEAGYQEKVRMIQNKLNAMDTDTSLYYLHEVFDDYFVYAKEGNGESSLYRRGYTYAEGESNVEFGENIEEVVKKTEYVKVHVKMKRIKNNNKGGKSTMDEKLKKLLTMANALYTEDDRAWLEKLEESQIDKLLTCAENAATAEKAKVKAEELVANMQAEADKNKNKNKDPEVNEEAALKILESQISDPEKFKKLLSPELRGQFEYGQQLYDSHRESLINHITTNQATDSWKKEDLEALDTATLSKIANAIKLPADYSAQGGEVNNNAAGEVLLPPGVSVEKEG